MNVSAQLQPAGGSGDPTLIGPAPRPADETLSGSGGFTTLLAQALELPETAASPGFTIPASLTFAVEPDPETVPAGILDPQTQLPSASQTNSAPASTQLPVPRPDAGESGLANLPSPELPADPAAVSQLLMPPTDPLPEPVANQDPAQTTGQELAPENDTAAELPSPDDSNLSPKGGLKVRSGRRQALHLVQPQSKMLVSGQGRSSEKSPDNSSSSPAQERSDNKPELVIPPTPAPSIPVESAIMTLGFFGAAPFLPAPVKTLSPTDLPPVVQNDASAEPVSQAKDAKPEILPLSTASPGTPTPGPAPRILPDLAPAPVAVAGMKAAPRPVMDPATSLPEMKQLDPSLDKQVEPKNPISEPKSEEAPEDLLTPESTIKGGIGAVAADGTGSAQSIEQMKQRLKSDEIAASVGKNLPEVMTAPVVSKSRNLNRLTLRTAPAVANELPLAASSASRLRTFSAPSIAGDSAPVSPVTRLFTGILEEATLVRRLRPDSLSVVIKPDSQTEIFVRLEMRDGRLEAAARCDRGDYQFLSAHWPELRQSLQHQGVRLQDLQQRPEGLSLHSGGLGNSPEQRRQTSSPEESVTPIAPAAVRSKSTVLTARSAAKTLVGKRLLESWA